MFFPIQAFQYIKAPKTLFRLSTLYKDCSYESWKNHAAVSRALTPCEHMIGMKVVRAFAAFCERYNITYWMIGGSLVGSVRYWDIIPWDRDFDFFVPKRDRELLERQFIIDRHEVPTYLRPGNSKHGPTKNFPESQANVQHPVGFYPFIDLFYYDENSTDIWDHKLCCHHHIKKSVVFPLSIRPLGSLWLPAPRDAFGYFKELQPPLFPHIETECHVRGYSANTKQIKFNVPLIVLCKSLFKVYPFVKRGNNSLEHLMFDEKVLQTLSGRKVVSSVGRKVLKTSSTSVRSICRNLIKISLADSNIIV